jgi:hypothetical protein
MSETHDDWLKTENLTDLAFPICCETEDLEGRWELVSLTKWLGNGKWLAFDQDGKIIVVDSAHLRNPRM